MSESADSTIPERTRGWRGYGSLRITRLSSDIEAERDVEVRLRDGVKLRCNVFRPRSPGQHPVLVHCVPYGKDGTGHKGLLVDRWSAQYIVMKYLVGGDIGELELSEATAWEACDPNTWCSRGYVVVACDSRGFAKSDTAGQDGAPKASVMTKQEAEDFYDLVEWCARQPWSNGRVGSIGVSYLAMSQWGLLSWAPPPSLHAAVIWEGCADLLRGLVNQGGAGPTRFARGWFTITSRLCKGGTKNLAQDLPAEIGSLADHRNVYTSAPQIAALAPPVEAIDTGKTAVMVAASWSDQGIHNPGTFYGWQGMMSRSDQPHAYLFTHGRGKWDGFYNWGLPAMERFLAHYLQGQTDEPLDMAPVRLEVRDDETTVLVRDEEAFPIPRTEPTSISLSRAHWQRDGKSVEIDGDVRLDLHAGGAAVFELDFDEDTEWSGFMAMALHVSLSPRVEGKECGDDGILCVQLHKLVPRPDGSYRQVHYPGVMGDIRESVTRGFMRLSHHVSYDPAASTPLQPYNTHATARPLAPGEVAPLHVALNPSSTRFRKGDRLQVVITGEETSKSLVMHHAHLRSVNGALRDTVVRLCMDGERAPRLTVPKIPDDGRAAQVVRYHNPAPVE
ncbi:MAG: CocE/NonD family hydrolase [Myxococcota bacterium]